MRRILLLLLWLALPGGGSVQASSGPVVQAGGEELHGAWVEDAPRVAVFRGVPFAAPPVGALRWRMPVQNSPRAGPQQATEFAPACMQTSYITDWYARVAAAFGQGAEVAAQPRGVSEDCLYLNIWTPRPEPTARLPVMVWVHGGSNRGGWSYEPNYLGSHLAAHGVVVVTIAYRLGPFGFFSHPALTNGAGQPVANFGLLDIDRALRWVAANITAFGGAPDNITAFGESSGAGNLVDLVFASSSRPQLIRRIILQSSAASLSGRRSLADERRDGKRLIGRLGLKGTITAERLRGIPASDLLAAAETETGAHYPEAVIDGTTMVQQPADGLSGKEQATIDLLIGTNADEWYMYLDPETDRDELQRWVRENAHGDEAALSFVDGGQTAPRHALDRLITARDMLCPTLLLASRVSAQGGHGRVYRFTRQRPGPGGKLLGAYHGAEIPYVFDTHDRWLPTTDLDRSLTAAVMDYWVQFARTGTPDPPGLPHWPIYAGPDSRALVLGDAISAARVRDAGLCALFGH